MSVSSQSNVSDGKRPGQEIVQLFPFDQPLRAIPKDKVAVILVGDLSQLGNPDPGIGGGLLQGQVAFLPDWDIVLGPVGG